MAQTTKQANIIREVLLTTLPYEDSTGFFFHTTGGGDIAYLPIGNEDSEIITKTFVASDTFNIPVLARKILSSGTTATGIYVGEGV